MEDMNADYEELKRLEEYVRELNMESGKIQEKSQEINNTKESLEALSNKGKGKESLLPIADGIFVRCDIKDPSNVLINVGSGTIVEKKIDEAKDMLDKQLQELEEYNERIIAEMSKTDEKAFKIQERLLKPEK